jgi:hypothetical protein
MLIKDFLAPLFRDGKMTVSETGRNVGKGYRYTSLARKADALYKQRNEQTSLAVVMLLYQRADVWVDGPETR